MRDVVFAWNDDEGKLRLSYPAWKGKKSSETDDQFLERVAKGLPNPTALHPIRDIPKDRARRNDWTLKDGKIVIPT